MSTAFTRFEVVLPNFDSSQDTVSFNAIETFIANMTNEVQSGTIKRLLVYQTNDFVTGTTFTTVLGYLASAQLSPSLGYLSTLNSSIAAQYSPVTCMVWTGTSQP